MIRFNFCLSLSFHSSTQRRQGFRVTATHREKKFDGEVIFPLGTIPELKVACVPENEVRPRKNNYGKIEHPSPRLPRKKPRRKDSREWNLFTLTLSRVNMTVRGKTGGRQRSVAICRAKIDTSRSRGPNEN